MSSTVMSHEGQAILFTSLIVSSKQPHPALKISTFRLLFTVHIPLFMHSAGLNRGVWSATRTHGCIRWAGPSIPHRCHHEKAHAAVDQRSRFQIKLSKQDRRCTDESAEERTKAPAL